MKLMQCDALVQTEDSIVFQQDLFDNGKNDPRILSIRQKQITKIYQVQFLVFT